MKTMTGINRKAPTSFIDNVMQTAEDMIDLVKGNVVVALVAGAAPFAILWKAASLLGIING